MSDLTYKVLNTDGTITVYDKAAEIDSQLTDLSHKYSNDFLNGTSALQPWKGTAIASGVIYDSSGIAKHPGAMYCSSHTSNANSGYALATSSTAILLTGGEKTTIIFKTATALAGNTRRLGFLDTVTASDAVDGAYLEIAKVGEDDGVIVGKTANNSTRSVTNTNYKLTAATYYRAVIELNLDATLVTFTVYADDSDTVLWSDTLATNIPTTRVTGHGDVCTLATPTAETVVGIFDYMDIILPNARRV